jgi:hypothetical protein
LLVGPKHAVPYGSADPRLTFCIEVINMSAFAVTVDDVEHALTQRRTAGVEGVMIVLLSKSEADCLALQHRQGHDVHQSPRPRRRTTARAV